MQVRYSPRGACVVSLWVWLVVAAATARGVSVPVNIPLDPGQTLYVRFAVTDLTNFPDPFSKFRVDYGFDQSYTGISHTVAIYDDLDVASASGSFGPLGGNVLGVGPTFGPSGTNVIADLSDLADGAGLASLTLDGGPSILIDELEVGFGQPIQFGTFYPAMPYDLTYAIDQLPPPVPEPGSIVLLTLAAVLTTRRQH